jgi:hypothetical protein
VPTSNIGLRLLKTNATLDTPPHFVVKREGPSAIGPKVVACRRQVGSTVNDENVVVDARVGLSDLPTMEEVNAPPRR